MIPETRFVTETMMDKKVKWLQFTGNEILFDDDSPLPFPGFSICPLFVFTDASKRTANHFGIVRLMKDPQREINKRFFWGGNIGFAVDDIFLENSQNSPVGGFPLLQFGVSVGYTF
jgi:hypothetical protein